MADYSEINIRVQLDKNKHPEKLEWQSTDAGITGFKECKASFLSLWDPEEQGALRIDLWTNDFRVDEMDKMVYETLMTLADTYHKATGNEKGAADLRESGKKFATKAGLLKSKS